MINGDEKTEFGAASRPTEEAGRHVVLLAGGGPMLEALALALAARGDSIALWEIETTRERVGEKLDLQLAIARAGGISLWVGEGELGVAAEAFGRIDTAVALTRDAAQRILAAAAPLERRLRPARLIVPRERGARETAEAEQGAALAVALNAEMAQAALGAEVPVGIRIYAMDLPPGEEAGEALRGMGRKGGMGVLAGVLEIVKGTKGTQGT